MRTKIDTVMDVVRHGLCCSCGTCVGMCPSNALSLTEDHSGIYVPVIDESKCSNCGLCMKVCPGYSVDFDSLNRSVFNTIPKDVLVGKTIASYLSYSLDDAVREGGQSGGAISSLLSFALEKGIIDGAIVTRMRHSIPLRPEVYIAKTRDDVLKASKSKYCPVPTNIIIREVLNTDGRFAFVGTSCQMQGIRKAEALSWELKEKIILHLGVFCDRTLNFHFQQYILSRARVKEGDVKEFSYRSKKWRGWPGDLEIQLKFGETIFLPKDWRISVKPLFTVQRCLLCFDKLNQLSDISFGDAWLHESSGDEKGLSVMISRNEWAQRLLVDALNEGIVFCEGLPLGKIVKGQRVREKEIIISRYCIAAQLLGMAVPRYKPEFADKTELNMRDLLAAFTNISARKILDVELARRCSVYIPMFLLQRLTRFML